MTDRNFLLAILFALTLVVATNAQDDDGHAIIKGYGKSTWGESPNDTAVNVTDLTLQRSTGNYEWHQSEAGPAMQTTYEYFNKQLFSIMAAYKLPGGPEQGVNEAGGEILKDKIKQKYYEDPTNAKALEEAMIYIHVVPWQDGMVKVIYENRSAFMKAPDRLPLTGSDAIDKASLRLTAHMVFGEWEEEDVLVNDSKAWVCSAGVIRKKRDRLHLVTNSHCLDLYILVNADFPADIAPDILSYKLEVKFANGQVREVLRFGDQFGTMDLALIEVDGRGLKEGRDYVILPYKKERLEVGDEVVAVGSPLGLLPGTHTFGRISAIRPPTPYKAEREIQIDAAINPGNSGGPLFVERNNRYSWIGVNTSGIEEADGLGFAIDAQDALRSQYKWYTANARGAAKAIREQYLK